MATTQSSVKLIKEFWYRGDPAQRWSNRYYFDGAAPADSDEWQAIFDGFAAAERQCYGAHANIVEAVGYNAGSDVAVASDGRSDAGSLSTSGTIETPGECAAILRQATTKLSTKNRRVYVFSYFHKALTRTSQAYPDELDNAQQAAIESFGNALVSGLTLGARTYKRTTPDGHLVTGASCGNWIGHRDFPR